MTENLPHIPAELVAENVRLRQAVAHLAIHARAVLDCRDNGGVSIAADTPVAYQASAAFSHLDECVARAVAGEWRPIGQEQIDAAWARYAKAPLWGEEYMTRNGWNAAIRALIWHPERQGPPHPPSRLCGCDACAPSFAAEAGHV